MVAAGAYLRAYRMRLGLSQDDVAKALGMSQPKVVTEWESGRRATSADVWNLWIEMVGANPTTAQHLVVYGKTLEEGRRAAQEEFTLAVKKASRKERDTLILRIRERLDLLRSEGDFLPIEGR